MGINEWIAVLGAIGGLEAIKWVVNFYVNRRTNARKEDATADSMEDENERKSHGWKNVSLNVMPRLMLFMLNSGRNSPLIWKIFIRSMNWSLG